MKRKERSVIGYLVLWGLILGAFAACTEEKETLNTPDNYEYFPLEVGKYWVYEVDSILFQNQTLRDSSKTWIKEQIIDYIIDNAGDTVYRVDQYDRKDTTQPWKIRRVVSLSRNATRAIRTEENISLIKMVFPLHRRGEWNSAAYVDTDLDFSVAGQSMKIFEFWGSRAEIDSIGQPITLGNLQFPETAKVTYIARYDVKTLNRVAIEVYAKGVGLISKKWQILYGECENVPCTDAQWRESAEKGFVLSQRLIEHN